MANTKGTAGPDPRPVDGFINGLPVEVTRRSSAAAELSVINGICSEGESA